MPRRTSSPVSPALQLRWRCRTPRSPHNYPNRPVIIVVPFAAGGAFDVLARVLAPRMGEVLGQQVVVENVSGASGIVGSSRVAHAAPDGYTVLLASIGTHGYNPSIYKKLAYDPVGDFTPVGLVAEQPMVLVARKDLPVTNLKEFIAYVKANHDKMQFGSAGIGSTTHLSCALVNAAIGEHPVHVPYRGGGPAMAEIVAGRIDYGCFNIGGVAGQIKAGNLKAIATLSRERAAIMPDLASAHEQGLNGFQRHNLERLPRAQRHAAGDRRQAQRGDEQDTRHAGSAGAVDQVRRRRRRARAAQPSLSRQVHPGRDCALGRADQGSRHPAGQIVSAARWMPAIAGMTA